MINTICVYNRGCASGHKEKAHTISMVLILHEEVLHNICSQLTSKTTSDMLDKINIK